MMSQCQYHIISTHHFFFSLLLFFTLLASCNKFHMGFLEHKVGWIYSSSVPSLVTVGGYSDAL